MDLKVLQKCGVVKRFQKGEFICLEKEMGNTAFLLLQGKAEVKLSSFQDKPKTVAVLDAGVIFGEMSLLENKPRTASIIVSSNEALVLIIEKENFLSILRADADIAYNLLQTMIGRMENSLEKMRDINIPFLAEFRRNKLYPQIRSLTKEQYEMIVRTDSEHTMRIAKFLSNSLATIDQEMTKRGFL